MNASLKDQVGLVTGASRGIGRMVAYRLAQAGAPGLIETEMAASLPEAVRTEYVKLIPAGRLGTAEEVAHAVLFLARPKSAYITGQVIGVNGGLYM
ncbi:MAG: SDR family oxidoreductase [Candidatus Binatia bacterium]|jgi:3-oxoacyl-[acyl-carrier protein] reductase